MVLLTIVSTIIGILCVASLIQYAKKWLTYFRTVNRIPGPSFFEGLSLAAEIARINRFDRYKIALRLINQYGLFFKIWIGLKPIVYIANAEAAMSVLNSSQNIDKTFAYKFFYPWLGTGLLTANGQKWHNRRKLLTSAFHFSILQNFFKPMVKHSNNLAKTLEFELESENFNITPYISNASLDIICETAMGVKLNEEANANTYRSSIRKITELIIHRLYTVWMWLDSVYKMTNRYKEQQKHLKVLHGLSWHIIQQRKKQRQDGLKICTHSSDTDNDEAKTKPAFLDLLLGIAENNASELSDTDIREEVDTFMFEGHDTVSVSIMWSIFFLGTYTHYQTKLYEELYSAFGDSDRDPTLNDINQLAYLDMVVKESLRLCPPVPIISRSLTEDINFGKYQIPAGASVAISILKIHHNSTQFPYADKFNPDNFLPEHVSRRHQYAYIPFSAGSRNCIGQRFGLMEVKVMLTTLIRRYEFETLVKPEDIKISSDTIFYPESGVIVKIRKRVRDSSMSLRGFNGQTEAIRKEISESPSNRVVTLLNF